ncbi:MAG: hypothetical protein V3U40_03675, partial [Candidatus Scalindua sediminis]
MFLSDWYYKRVGLDCNIKAYPPSPFGEMRIVISYWSFVIRKGWILDPHCFLAPWRHAAKAKSGDSLRMTYSNER